MQSIRQFIQAILLEQSPETGAGGLVRPPKDATSKELAAGTIEKLNKTIPDITGVSPAEKEAIAAAYSMLELNNSTALFDDVVAQSNAIGYEGFATDEEDVKEFANAVSILLKADAAAALQEKSAIQTAAGAVKPKYNYPWRTALFVISYQTAFNRAPEVIWSQFWDAISRAVVQNAAELERNVQQDLSSRGIESGTQQEARLSLKRLLLNEGLGTLGIHAAIYGIFRLLSRSYSRVSALRAFLKDEDLWREAFEKGSGGVKAAKPIKIPFTNKTLPMITDPGLDITAWTARKIVTGFDRLMLKQSVSSIELAVKNLNAAFPEAEPFDAFEVSRVARDAVNARMATSVEMPTKEMVDAACTTGLSGAAKDLQLENAAAYEQIQIIANAEIGSGPGATASVKIPGQAEPVTVTSGQVKAAKEFIEGVSKGTFGLVSGLWSTRTAAQVMHVTNYLGLAWIAYDLYEIAYVGTAYLPVDASPSVIAAVCTSSKIRKLAFEDMAKIDDSLNKIAPNITTANSQLSQILGSPANLSIDSSEMEAVADLYDNFFTS